MAYGTMQMYGVRGKPGRGKTVFGNEVQDPAYYQPGGSAGGYNSYQPVGSGGNAGGTNWGGYSVGGYQPGGGGGVGGGWSGLMTPEGPEGSFNPSDIRVGGGYGGYSASSAPGYAAGPGTPYMGNGGGGEGGAGGSGGTWYTDPNGNRRWVGAADQRPKGVGGLGSYAGYYGMDALKNLLGYTPSQGRVNPSGGIWGGGPTPYLPSGTTTGTTSGTTTDTTTGTPANTNTSLQPGMRVGQMTRGLWQKLGQSIGYQPGNF